MVTTNPKADLRKLAIEARDAAADKHGATRSGERLAAVALAFPPLAKPCAVSGFLAIGKEIELGPLMQALADRGHRLCLPVMVGKGKPLIFRAYQPGDSLKDRMWGIREPHDDKQEVAPDVLLVPMLCVDDRGWRLGYGGGFYDRTLRALREKKSILAVGVGYDEQRIDAVPHLDYDEPLDWVLTPSGARRCHRDRNRD